MRPTATHTARALLFSCVLACMLAASPPALAQQSTVQADRSILQCPAPQTPVKSDARPDPDVIKKVLRCGLGEKAARTGLDGAVTIEISALELGTPRPWNIREDKNGGVPGKTTVFPIKVTYSKKTFYRSSTDTGANWIRIFNFFVNGFGEWEYGSVQTIKMPDQESTPVKK